MDQYNLGSLALKLRIAPRNILRENIEVEVLNIFAHDEIAAKTIFCGGTALRLAYGSPRYSEDLDFLMTKKVTEKELEQALAGLARARDGLALCDIKEKRNTLFALIGVSHAALKHPVNVKIEICRRKNGVRFEHVPLSTPCSHLSPIYPTATAPSLRKLKEAAVMGRSEPRDWFDLWYITKYLKEPWKPPRQIPFEAKEFKRELRRFLPRDAWVLIDQLLEIQSAPGAEKAEKKGKKA